MHTSYRSALRITLRLQRHPKFNDHESIDALGPAIKAET